MVNMRTTSVWCFNGACLFLVPSIDNYSYGVELALSNSLKSLVHQLAVVENICINYDHDEMGWVAKPTRSKLAQNFYLVIILKLTFVVQEFSSMYRWSSAERFKGVGEHVLRRGLFTVAASRWVFVANKGLYSLQKPRYDTKGSLSIQNPDGQLIFSPFGNGTSLSFPSASSS